MRYLKLEVVSDGEFPMDGASEDDIVATISDHLAQVGLTVNEVFSEIIEKEEVKT